jgi:hypothetical protein
VSDPDRPGMSPEVAAMLARWPGLAELLPVEELTAILDGVRDGLDRLYAIDVERFEFDFLVPDTRAT